MGPEDLDDWDFYRVVVNTEGQYSLWRDDLMNPQGWQDAGFRGSKEECVAYIKKMFNKPQPPG